MRLAVVDPDVAALRVASARISSPFDEFTRGFIERPELFNILSENPVLFAAASTLDAQPSMLLVESHGCDNCADTTLA
jgi:hypothetical protein